MQRLRARVAQSSQAFGLLAGNPDLRRLQLALVGSVIGSWGYTVAILVWAYGEGGTLLTGVAMVIRLVPAALASPFAGALADRMPRRRVMVASDLLRAACLALAALGMAAGAPVLVLVAIGVSAAGASAFRPAMAALLPSLTRTPDELTAANVAGSAIQGVGMFAGPALGGILLAVSSPQVVLLATVGTLLWSAGLVASISGEPPVERGGGDEVSLLRDTVEGLRVAHGQPGVRLLLVLIFAQTLVAGLVDVLVVVTALRVLGRDQAWVGYLNAAVGVGALLGAAAAAGLVGRRRLAGPVAVGLVLFGAPMAVAGLWVAPVVALAALGVLGLGNTLVDVAADTLLQRIAPEAAMARVFAALETLVFAGVAVGGLLAPALVAVAGARGALVVTGALMPLITLLAWSRLRAVDAEAPAPGRALELLRALPIFAPLAAPELERLAFDAVPVGVAAGTAVFHQGEPGDRFYVVSSGEVDVDVDGAHVRTEGPGEAFGEIALLREVPRTATVTARGDAELYALGRDAFVAAVTGHAASREAAEGIAAARLASAAPAVEAS